VYPNQVITQATAIALLDRDLAEFEQGVSDLVQVPLTDNQYAALVSFTFNVGLGAFGSSTMLGYLNSGNYAAVGNQFGLWVNGGGRVLPGLVRRRQAELRLFLT
jgi:lysozyme